MKEYYYDPNAPQATKLVNIIEVAVVNNKGEILMTRKKWEEKWSLPKGEAKIGNCLDYCAMDLIDHSSLCIETADIIALYSNPNILFEDEETHSVRQEIISLFYMKELFCEQQKDTEDTCFMWVKLENVDSVPMPYSVRLHMRDIVNYATKKRKNIRANDDDKSSGPSCYLLREKDMTEPILEAFKLRNNKTAFVDVKEIKDIPNQCKDEQEREKTIKKWCNAQHGIVFDNFDFCFGDAELQRILLRVVSVRNKRRWVTELITYQSFYDNADKINEELYMILVASFYQEVNNNKDLVFLSKFLTRYCHSLEKLAVIK